MKSIVNKISNKYSNLKIVWFPNKLMSMRDKVVTAPLYVRIKPINQCCHDCFFCVYNSTYSKMHDNMKKIDKLSKEKLFEILNDLKTMGVNAVTYSGGGEPLMHPNIIDIMEKTVEYNIDLSIITNGQLLNGDRAKLLCGAKWVRISMDYSRPEEFVESKRGTVEMFNKIIDNIKKFSEIKNTTCDLSVNFIITNKNAQFILHSAELLKSLNIDNVRYSPVWTTNFIEYHTPIMDRVKKDLDMIKKLYQTDTFKIYDSYNIIKDVIDRKYNKCYVMQYNPVIGADNNVYVCHNKSYTNDGCIGSIKTQSFKDLWYSKDTQKYFESFNPQQHCKCQCANDKKNLLIHEFIDCYGDNFI